MKLRIIEQNPIRRIKLTNDCSIVVGLVSSKSNTPFNTEYQDTKSKQYIIYLNSVFIILFR